MLTQEEEDDEDEDEDGDGDGEEIDPGSNGGREGGGEDALTSRGLGAGIMLM